ncbi:trk system potassium uptake protein TrkA [Arcanobacterium wilhelmae]|uniref:Trk system potassium uptake protein TrkA n=1 Tax=Arcanobacterium wilhelmae TaxID=1803177 RepID=A0ABT9NAA8_9ACTO|nr:TrkA family potassium uptake protein [Arcanobacterium wilhelmae]MDP9800151.1 trk system potassium uptake protein TrkA [Arcanobacterium wilhelmae]WFN89591.1 TrkA family potassium uptake protein [Arcanobacterium wilhelmae]
MHFVVMGCGRVGSTLAVDLVNRGHSVAIIDRDPAAFRRLPEDFPGQQVTGHGFDRDILIQAGIEEAHAFAAAASGDNSNIIAARVVRDTFGVSNVVTRIYDPQRATIYQRLGIDSVAPVTWTADSMLRALIPLGPHEDYSDSAAGISLIEVDVDDAWFGTSVTDVETATSARVAYIVRANKGLLPQPSTVLQDDDRLHMMVPTSRATAVQRILNHPPTEDML